MHTWLLQLKLELITQKQLPSTVFHQVDGGSENANRLQVIFLNILIDFD